MPAVYHVQKKDQIRKGRVVYQTPCVQFIYSFPMLRKSNQSNKSDNSAVSNPNPEGTLANLAPSLHIIAFRCTSLHFTSLHVTSLHFTSLFTSLHFTSLPSFRFPTLMPWSIHSECPVCFECLHATKVAVLCNIRNSQSKRVCMVTS